MGRMPGSMYREITQYPYTRREYMGGVPQPRILQFESGAAADQAQFHAMLHLVPEERGQITHNAMEAMRQTCVRALDKKIGRANYFMKVRVYPHHVLRQNKQASGAGADRVSMGMRLAFGKAIGTAARIEAGQRILTVKVRPADLPAAKDAMRKSYNKIAMPCHIDVEGHWDLAEEKMVTRAPPKPVKEPKAEKPAGEAGAAGEAKEGEKGDAKAGEKGDKKAEGKPEAKGGDKGKPAKK